MATYSGGGISNTPKRSISGSHTSVGYWAAAALTTALTGTNNDLTYTAKTVGASGNAITLTYVVAGVSTPLSVSVSGNAITVNVATDATSVATSTAAQVRDAVNASGPASALVTAANATGNDGTGVVTALAATPLAGGTTQRHGSGGFVGAKRAQRTVYG